MKLLCLIIIQKLFFTFTSMKKLFLLILLLPILGMAQTTSLPSGSIPTSAATSYWNPTTHRWTPKVGSYWYELLTMADTSGIVQTIANLHPRGNTWWLQKKDSNKYVTPYYFNTHQGTRQKTYIDSLNAAIFSQNHTYTGDNAFTGQVTVSGHNLVLMSSNLNMAGGIIQNVSQVIISDANMSSYTIQKLPGTMQMGTTKYGFVVDSATNKIYSSGSGGAGAGIPYVLASGTSSQYIKGDGTFGTFSGGSGTVTSFGKVDGFGIISSVANSTTTPVHTISVDTANIVSKTFSARYISTNSNASVKSLTVTGTGGLGYLFLPAQSSAPTTPGSGNQILYANSAGGFTMLGSNGFGATLVKTPLTASRSYYLPDVTDTLVNAARLRTYQTYVGTNYLKKDSTLNTNKNLYDVPSKSTARTNLDVYSTAQTNAAIATVASTIPIGGNPTATANYTAVNGSALTWMRSDAAPAIDSTASTGFKTNASATTDRNNIITRLNAKQPTLSGTGTVYSTAGVITYRTSVKNETPSGAMDGVNMVFTLLHPPVSAIDVYYNGVYETNYSLSGNTITFTFAPSTSSGSGLIKVNYAY